MQARSKWALLFAGCFLLAASTTVKAQFGGNGFRVNPFLAQNLALQQAAVNQAILGRAILNQGVNPYINPGIGANPYVAPAPGAGLNPYLGGRITSVTANPYVGSQIADPLPGYGNPYANPYFANPYYIPNPYEGYLQGVSSVIDAQGQYAINYQKARLMNQQAEQAKIETRRKLFDEWRYERMHTPTYEQRRAKKMEQQLVRAKANPPLTEILNADALNTILRHLKKLQSEGTRGPTLPLDADTLAKINVTTNFGGNIGLLRDSGKLNWPLPLRRNQFDDARDRFSRAGPDAVRQAELTGRVDASVLEDMLKDVKSLRKTLDASVGDMSPSEYIHALRYINLLDDAMRALQDPQVANYFTKKFAANGADVAELVSNMTKLGLIFAPATPGDEAAYRTLHGALVAFANALDRQITKK